MIRPISLMEGLLVSYALVGCAAALTPATMASAPSIRYTLVNLHPDEVRGRLYTVNYQQPGLIPRCTGVRFVETTSGHAIFEIASSGRRYLYISHATLREPFGQHLDRYFGKRCDPGTVATLSEGDRDGIARGKALTGMTKGGVILAIGYPPEHATPSLDADVWTYWKSRMQTFDVEFMDGKVARIVDSRPPRK